MPRREGRGRPPIYKTSMRQVSLRLPVALLNQLDDLVDAEGVNRQETIRTLLQWALNNAPGKVRP